MAKKKITVFSLFGKRRQINSEKCIRITINEKYYTIKIRQNKLNISSFCSTEDVSIILENSNTVLFK
jgi:hypothetical protein